MLYQISKRFALAGITGSRKPMLRITMALGLAMVLPVVAAAYTLVLRDGRHTEIPANFVVAGKAVTYERAPGFNITLQLSIIDIPATERINNEEPGSFMKRSASTAAVAAFRPAKPPVSVTNANLERWRQARLESEKEFEQRRRALGLPSMEEMRRKQEQETEETLEVLRPRIAAEQAKEAYWRARASDLRAELAAVDAQLSYLQSRLAGLSNTSIGVPPGSVGPFLNFGSTRGFRTRPLISGRLGFGRGTWNGGIVLSSGGRRPAFGHPVRFGRRGFVPFRSGFAFPSAGWSSQSYENSYERDNLVQQLDELVSARAAALARWRLLEEEARRAGAYPGWLRP